MVMMLNQCCCGCTLQTGTIILGVLNIIYAGAYLIFGIVTAGVSDFVEGEIKAVLIGVGAAMAVFSGIMLLVAICLIIGAQKGNPALLLPWLVYTVIFLIANTVLNIVYSVEDFYAGLIAGGAIIIVLAIIQISFQIYFLLVVYSLYRQLKGTGPSFTS